MGSPAEEFGPYLVYEQLGIGGMASVHRAETTGIHGFRRPIALKRMLPHVAENADLVASFVREARLASYLRHSNVAQTYELGKVDDIYFIAMELVIGHNLREILQHCVRTRSQIPLPISLNILNQVCDALDYAHNLADEMGRPLGIIHRDVSPSNVIVSDSGVVKLIDFGIAKASGDGMQTQSGTIKGKFGYMAPEYLGGKLDARADLFAVGVIAHELLTSRPLFGSGDDLNTLMRVKSMPIPPPSRWNAQVPREIDALVMTALERDPDQRWQRASAMRQALSTETQRLGLAALDYQVVAWCEQIFAGGDEPTTDEVAASTSDGDSVVIEHVPDLPPAPPPELAPTDELAATALRLPRAHPSSSGPYFAQPPPELRSGPYFAQSPSGVYATRSSAPHPAQTLAGVPAPSLSRPHPVQTPSGSLAAQTPSGAFATQPAPPRRRHWLIALLLLATAAAAGAVVYFALPYLQPYLPSFGP